MVFEAKKFNLDLNCKGEDGQQKVFQPKERITAAFAEKIMTEHEIYMKAQEDLPDSEKDKMIVYYLKFLSWVYNLKKEDTTWLKTNFAFNEIKAIFNWVNEGLLGVKKDEES